MLDTGEKMDRTSSKEPDNGSNNAGQAKDSVDSSRSEHTALADLSAQSTQSNSRAHSMLVPEVSVPSADNQAKDSDKDTESGMDIPDSGTESLETVLQASALSQISSHTKNSSEDAADVTDGGNPNASVKEAQKADGESAGLNLSLSSEGSLTETAAEPGFVSTVHPSENTVDDGILIMEDSTDSDQSSDNDCEVIALSEEDAMPSFVITDVRSIQAQYDEDFDVATVTVCSTDSNSTPNKSENVDTTDSSSVGTKLSGHGPPVSVSSLTICAETPSSSGLESVSKAKGSVKSNTLVLDFEEMKQQAAQESGLMGQQVRDKLSSASSTLELQEAVSCLVESHGEQDNTSEDIPPLQTLPIPALPQGQQNNTSENILPLDTLPSPAASQLHASPAIYAAPAVHVSPSGEGQPEITILAKSTAECMAKDVTSQQKSTQSGGRLINSSGRNVSDPRGEVKKPQKGRSQELSGSESPESFTVKLEVEDEGYEAGPAGTVSSGPRTIQTSQSADPSASNARPQRKRTYSSMEGEGLEENSRGAVQSRPTSGGKAGGGDSTFPSGEQVEITADTAAVASSAVARSSQVCPALPFTGGITSCSAGSVSSPAGAQSQSAAPYSTVSKPLLVPSTLTESKAATEVQQGPGKRIVFAIPSRTTENNSQSSQLPSSVLGQALKTSVSLPQNSEKTPATVVASASKQGNKTLAKTAPEVRILPASQQVVSLCTPKGQFKIVVAATTQSLASSLKTVHPSVSLTAAANPPVLTVSGSSPSVATTPSQPNRSVISVGPAPQGNPARPVVISLLGSQVTTSVTSTSTPTPSPSVVKIVSSPTSSVVIKPAPSVQKVGPTSSTTVVSKPEQGVGQDTVKLSASDMAGLIQGGNLIPPLEPRRRPGSSNTMGNLYRCVECGSMYSTVVGYKAHVKRMSMVIRYACMLCKAPLIFFNKCTFLAHLRKHTITDSSTGHVLNLKSYTMSVSSLPTGLLPPADLQHMDPLVINRFQPIRCSECREQFADTMQLSRHFGGKRSRSKLCTFEYTCTHCKMELPSSCSLQAHLRLHDDETHVLCAQPDFVCPECGLRFYNQVSLYQHLFATCLHFSRIIMLRCPVCGKFYPTLELLASHMTLLHPNPKRLLCLLCKRTYNSLMSFSHHVPQLHKERAAKDVPYHLVSSCSICKAKKLPAVEGKKHAEMHIALLKPTVEFGFICMFCKGGILFACREHLIKHLVTNHDAYKFVCSICKLGFVTLSLLRMHVLMAHSSKHRPDSDKAGKDSSKCLCTRCKNSTVLNSESALPHVMWHVMKKLGDTQDAGACKHFMEIMVPSIAKPRHSMKLKKMMICRVCGLLLPSLKNLELHVNSPCHKIWNRFYICPCCQRYDFESNDAFVEHKQQCIGSTDEEMGNGVAILEKETQELREAQARGDGVRASVEQYRQTASGSVTTNITGGQPTDLQGTGKLFRAILPKAQKRKVAAGNAGPGDKLRRLAPIATSPASTGHRDNSGRPGTSPAVETVMETSRAVQQAAGSPPLQDDSVKDDCREIIDLATEDTEGDAAHNPPPYHLCHLCGASYLSAACLCVMDLARENVNREEEPSQPQYHLCHLCGISYLSASVLAAHTASVHRGEKNVLACQLCQKKGKTMVLSRKNLKKHLTRRHNVAKPLADSMVDDATQEQTPPYSTQQMSAADSETSSVSSMCDPSPVKHLRIDGDDTQEYVCAKCSFTSSGRAEFRGHIASHAMDDSVQCLECGLCFSAVPSLKRHLFMVHKVKQPEAYITDHDIKLKELPSHISSHMDSLAPFEEPEIVMETTFHRQLRSESLPVLDQEEERAQRNSEESGSLLECKVCYKDFETELMLKCHMRTHGMAFIRSRRTALRPVVGEKEGGDDGSAEERGKQGTGDPSSQPAAE